MIVANPTRLSTNPNIENIPTQCIDYSKEICLTLIYNKTHVEINLKLEKIQSTITYLKPPKPQDLTVNTKEKYPQTQPSAKIKNKKENLK